MINKRRKFIFKTINIILEDDKFGYIRKSGIYSKISATSYRKMQLPDFETLVKTTAIIDLIASKDKIFRKFNDTTRNEIRKTERNDILKFISDDNNFKESYWLYKNLEYAQGRVPASKADLNKCKLFSCYYKGEMISAVYLMTAYPYLRVRSIFSKRLQIEDKEAYKIISNTTRRLILDICLWGKEREFQSLDLASVNFKNPKTANITKFKMSFGGTVVNEYTYIYKSKSFKFFEKFVFLKIFILKLVNLIKK